MERLEDGLKGQAERVEELKVEWKRLWRERFDDKLRAEGIADKDYSSLFVERGTVIFATRSFKLLSFKGILEEHGIRDLYKFVSPNPEVGGWRKFIKSTVSQGRPNGRTRHRAAQYLVEKKEPQQLKKGGRGWLHL